MDPVTAIGLASGILSFVTFSSKLIGGAINIYDATDGHLVENRSLELLIQEMKKLSEQLLAPDDSNLVGQDKGLCALAAECNTLSSDLIALLERIKPKDSKSKAQSLWSALKNVTHEKEKTELEQRLDRCRNQLELQITFLTSRETRASLDSLLSMAKTDNNTLLRLQGNIEQLGQGIQVSSLSETAQRQVRELVEVQESVLHAIARQRVLEALSFGGMNGRYNMLDDAYVKTFQWIFGDAYPRKLDDGDLEGLHVINNEVPGEIKKGIRPEHDDVERDENALEIKRVAREKFMGWLSSQNGIFHISGKLGSGKSTLMRFLYEHSGTKSELVKWAGDRAVVLAGFFFWNPGSDLQKSLTGLFRSILHSILEQCPELVPQALPDLWAKARAAPLQAQLGITPSEKDIQIAFNRLIRSKALYERRCLCIFIDGLDEFHPTPRVDRKALVDLLHSWTTVSPGVKLCVSSREDNVFMNAFSPERRFRLHELTKHDMRSYVTDKLRHLPDGSSKIRLINAIPERAQGIFLWVSVVSKSMREEFENGKAVESLWRMLEALPDELHDLFEHILRSLSRTVRKRAYQTLKMLLLSKEIGIAFHVVGYSFFEDYESGHGFAMTDDFKTRAAGKRGNSDFIARRTDIGQKQLNGSCRGLLEVIPARPGELAAIDYTHRSVAEFLGEEDVRAEIARLTEGFDCTDALSQLVLATQSHIDDTNLRCSPFGAPPTGFHRSYPEIMKHRQERGLDLTPPFEFLESLASLRAYNPARSLDPHRWVDMLLCLPVTPQHGHISLTVMEGKMFGTPEQRRFEHPLTIAARLRNYDYVIWKLRQDPVLATDTDVMALMTFALVWTDAFYARDWDPPSHERALDLGFVGRLLNEGLIQPSSLTTLQPYVWPSYFNTACAFKIFPHAKSPGGTEEHGNRDMDFNVTIWDHLLVMFFLTWLAPTRLEPSYLGKVLRVFLEHGAGASTLYAGVEVIKDDEGLVKNLSVRFEAEAEDETKIASITYRNDDSRAPQRSKHHVTPFRDVSTWDFVEEEEGRKTFKKTFTIRSWLEYCTYEELPNKDQILEILDQRTMKTPWDVSPNSKEADAPEPSGCANGHSKAASEIGDDGASGQKTGARGNPSLPGSEPRKPGGSLFLMASQVRDAHTPSSVFGFLLVIFMFMLSVEIIT